MYEIIITKKAEKNFTNLDKNTKTIIAKKIKEYSINPFAHCKKLTDPKIGSYRFRIGE